MFLNLKDFAGTSPHTPSLTCDAAGAGGTAQKARALPPALAAECIFWAGRQGVSKKIYKDDKAVFTNLSGRPPPALVQVTEARRYFALLDFTGYRSDTEKGGNRPSKGKKHVP